MPTGYTAAIKDGITFEQFVWGCARGMGALVMMRDEPSNAPIPERFEPQTAYHDSALAEAEKQLAWLRQMPAAEAQREADRDFATQTAQQAEMIQKSVDLRNKYHAILAQVIAWTPPTPDHIGMKTFMTEQLTESIKWDCNEDYYREHPAVRLTGAEWVAARISKFERDVAYHTEQRAAEVERTEQRNNWLSALRGSLECAKP